MAEDLHPQAPRGAPAIGPATADALERLLGSRPPVAEPQPGPVRNLGVLLVHGIGQQRRGSTLTRFGEPLYDCLERWLRNRKGGAAIERVALRRDEKEDEPAHAGVRLWWREEPKPESASETAPDDAGGAAGGGPPPGEESPDEGAAADRSGPTGPIEARWLLAESNWADVFEQPGFGSVAYWSIRIVPWLILTQFTDQLADALRRGKAGRAVLSFGNLVIAFPLSLLIQLLVLLLVPLSLLPPLRPLVAPVQRWVSGVLGDTYVLLTSRFQFQSMVGKVAHDLEWLLGQCDVVAVLAHSQGAAVAHEAVRQCGEPRLERLVTFGSAVSRLKALRHVLYHARGMLAASTLLTLSALVLAGLYLWHLLSSGGSLAYLVFGVWGLAVLLAFAGYVMPLTLKVINELCHEKQEFALGDTVGWDDYYATSDPIPNGRMYPPGRYTASSREVHNRANFLSDHSSYQRNQDEFVPLVTGTLMRLTGGPFETHAVRPKAGWRERRTFYQVMARGTAIAALSVALFRHPLLPPGLGLPGAVQAPFSWAAAFVNWLLSLVGDAVGFVGSTLNLTPETVPLPRIAVPVVELSWPVAVALVVAAWFAVSAVLLRWWEAGETERLFRPGADEPHAWARRLWWTAFVALALPWLGFWVSWLRVAPSEVWTQIAGRAAPAAESSQWMVAFVVYILADAVWKSLKIPWDLQRALRKQDEDMQREADELRRIGGREWLIRRARAQASTDPLARLELTGGTGGLASEESPSALKLLGQVFADKVKKLGERRFGARPAALVALLMAVGSSAVVLLETDVRGTVQAAFALVSLCFGVLGWVEAPGWAWRSVSAAGLTAGVLTMPVAAALGVGVFTGAGAGLLTAGLLAAAGGIAGAELLRRGWSGVAATAAD